MACKGRRSPDYNCPGWKRLSASIMERDGHQCRNCGSEKELVVHHWRPIADESEGITMWGYRKAKCPLIVPESGLVTVCVICHGSLTSARDRVKIRDDVSQLGPVSVPERDWHN